MPLFNVSAYENTIAKLVPNPDLNIRWGLIRPADETAAADYDQWSGGAAGSFYVYGTAGIKTPILPAKYLGVEEQKARLYLDFNVLVESDADVKVTIWDQMAKGPKIAIGDLNLDLVREAEPNHGFKTSYHVDVPFSSLSFTVNKNLFVGIVKVVGLEIPGFTTIPLHVLLQKSLVLFPGVMATKLKIDGDTCWPRVKGFESTEEHAKYLRRMACTESGVPILDNKQLEIIEKPAGGPYHTNNWMTWMNETYPRIYKKMGAWTPDRPVYAHYIQQYPYDWRPKIELLIDTLVGVEGNLDGEADSKIKSKASYGTEPSLKTVVKYIRKGVAFRTETAEFPFIDSKVNVAGHSTGGLVVNGLIRRDEAAQLVDRAFCIAAPFQGAVKAYNAFLLGTMDISAESALGGLVGIGNKDVMRQVGMNFPVFYYLAPNKLYDAEVIKVEHETVEEQVSLQRLDATAEATSAAINKVISWMKKFNMFNLGAAAFQDFQWRQPLQEAADAFHLACQEDIQAASGELITFYSDYPNTDAKYCYGSIELNAKNYETFAARLDVMKGNLQDVQADKSTHDSLYQQYREELNILRAAKYKTGTVAGDGTVPKASLQNGLDETDAGLVKIAGDRDHVDVTNAKALWETIVAKSEVKVGD